MTLSQVDPRVLAELPREVRDEVLAALPAPKGKSLKKQAQQLQASKQQDQLYHTVGLRQVAGGSSRDVYSRSTGQQVVQPGAVLFLQESVDTVCEAITSAVHSIADTCNESAAVDVQHGASRDGNLLSDSAVPISPDIVPATDNPTAGEHNAASQVAVATRKLEVLAEYVVQWLISNDSDLELVAKVLRVVARLQREVTMFQGIGQRIQAAVQTHVLKRFGFKLIYQGLLTSAA